MKMLTLITTLLLITSSYANHEDANAEYIQVNCSTGERYTQSYYLKLEELELYQDGPGFRVTGKEISSTPLIMYYKSNVEYVNSKYELNCNSARVYNKIEKATINLRCIGGTFRTFNHPEEFNQRCSALDLDFDLSELPMEKTIGEKIEDILSFNKGTY